MKIKGIILILIGALGAVFVCAFDKIMGKPDNDISGPKSISALVICALLVIAGVYVVLAKQKKK